MIQNCDAHNNVCGSSKTKKKQFAEDGLRS